ncbi:ScbA/BarX family gamma-butyrolactone biosynthesis protein [Streptomyces sp. NPDC056463]|uniref:ScbA/BarX family gamma-butyrolactone biosynthesis protein n=1 Tax=Streptomyces sp. NPDC056463 TaxID=3345827 RepID=UPI0036B3FF0A
MPAVSVARCTSRRLRPAPSSTTDLSALLGGFTHLTIRQSILVTSWERTGEHTSTLRVHWPSASAGRPYDPRVLNQTIRQSGLVVAHAEYDVPLDHQTLLRFLDITVADPFPIPDGQPAHLDVDVTVARPKGGRQARSSLHMDFRIRHEGTTVARADSEFGWISPQVYRRVRGEHLTVDWGSWPLPEPVDPVRVGREDTTDVLLSPTGDPYRWHLRNDVANTVLFDHPVDHVPGLTLMEAADQAAHAVLGPETFRPTEVSTSYVRYVEFDRPCLIEAELLPAEPGRFAVSVTGTQDGTRAFSAVFRGAGR